MERGSKNGSTVVLLLVISTFIMMVATVALRSGTLLYELALDRVAHFKQLRASQALAYYGISYCKTIRGSKSQSHSLSFNHWPSPDGAYEGNISIESKEKGYSITTMLTKKGEEINMVRVEIGQQKGVWRIVSWQNS